MIERIKDEKEEKIKNKSKKGALFGTALLTMLGGVVEDGRAGRMPELPYEIEHTFSSFDSLLSLDDDPPKYDVFAARELLASVNQNTSKLDERLMEVRKTIKETRGELDPETTVLVGYAQRDLIAINKMFLDSIDFAGGPENIPNVVASEIDGRVASMVRRVGEMIENLFETYSDEVIERAMYNLFTQPVKRQIIIEPDDKIVG